MRKSDIPTELVGSYKEVKVEAPGRRRCITGSGQLISSSRLRWLFAKEPHLAIVQTFLEYRRIKRGNQIINETMDYVDSPESAENKIIPDAAFILENMTSKRRALFFLEMDMGTERIITASPLSNKQTSSGSFPSTTAI